MHQEGDASLQLSAISPSPSQASSSIFTIMSLTSVVDLVSIDENSPVHAMLIHLQRAQYIQEELFLTFPLATSLYARRQLQLQVLLHSKRIGAAQQVLPPLVCVHPC